jgi:hypothetical protein
MSIKLLSSTALAYLQEYDVQVYAFIICGVILRAVRFSKHYSELIGFVKSVLMDCDLLTLGTT